MATKEVRGKHRIQVSLSESDYQLIRKLAFDMEVTVNECLRMCAIAVAKNEYSTE